MFLMKMIISLFRMTGIPIWLINIIHMMIVVTSVCLLGNPISGITLEKLLEVV